jgi:hypothetical protein
MQEIFKYSNPCVTELVIRTDEHVRANLPFTTQKLSRIEQIREGAVAFLWVSVYNVYITNQFKSVLRGGGRG